MIAQANGDHFRIVGLIFFQAKHLRRAAFGRNAVGRGVKELIARSVGCIRHAVHRLTHQSPSMATPDRLSVPVFLKGEYGTTVLPLSSLSNR